MEETCGPMTEEQKDAIWYRCGRSPYYLTDLGDAARRYGYDGALKGGTFAADQATSFREIVNLLKGEELLSAMLKMFVGPAYDMKASDVTDLITMGYCLRSDTMISPEKYIDYRGGETAPYLTVCNSLADYLRDECRRELEDIWPHMTRVEMILRRIITSEYQAKYGSGWEEKLKNQIKNYDIKAMKKHETVYNQTMPDKQQKVGNSILNIVNFNVLKEIVVNNWDGMFENHFKIKEEEFAECVEVLGRVRNPLAHSNGELLTPHVINIANEKCDMLYASIDAKWKD